MKAHIPSGIANESATPYALVWHCVRNFAELGNKLDRTHRVINFKLTTTASSSCRAQLTITEGPLLGYVAREISDTVPANLDHFSAPSPARTTDKKLQAVDYAGSPPCSGASACACMHGSRPWRPTCDRKAST